MTIGAEDDDARRWLRMHGEALGDAVGAAGGTFAMLTAHAAGVMPCLGEGEELGRECLPLPAQAQPSRALCRAGQAATRAWTGASSSLWAQQLCSEGEACNPEGLAESGGKERLIRQSKVPDNKLPAGLEWCTHFTG